MEGAFRRWFEELSKTHRVGQTAVADFDRWWLWGALAIVSSVALLAGFRSANNHLDWALLAGCLTAPGCLLAGAVGRYLYVRWRIRAFLLQFVVLLDKFTRRESQEDYRLAAEAAEVVLSRFTTTQAPWAVINDAVCALISRGRYAAALAAPSRWTSEGRESGRLLDPDNWALAEINLAEAEYCSGQIQEAFRRMNDLAERVSAEDGPFQGAAPEPIVALGLVTQQTWIACLRGDPTAVTLLEGTDDSAFPAEFRAEYHYTRAFALATAGDHEQARVEADTGCKASVRLSSQRNGIFLLATLAVLRGDTDTALERFHQGASHPFRYQGGDALWVWSQTLRGLGRAEEADEVLALLRERDPESGAAVKLGGARAPHNLPGMI